MQQKQPEGWERVAIIVATDTTPKTARYYQLPSGPLEWRDDLPKLEYRVSCFYCHANGPRVVRPQPGSLGWTERIRTAALNWRIKSYGRVVPHPDHVREDQHLSRPFREPHPVANEPLVLGACIRCHKEDGFLPRGTLTRQHAGTIRHMVEKGHMPPWPFKLSPSEKKELENFLAGF